MPPPANSTLLAAIQSALGSTFTFERELGGGGMSHVFLAEERSLHRQVVIKVLRGELAASVSAHRFSREVRLAAQLQQANIVPVIAIGDADGFPYYTMPFVAGESLRTLLDATPQLPIGQVIDILVDVARALAYAHERGIVHRDIKPENILLSGATAVVTDFGIAKALSASRIVDAGDSLTTNGLLLGTPTYIAPEQALGEPTVDHRADLYALGIVGYEMLAGAPPFISTSLRDLIRAHVLETPVPIATRRPDTPPALVAAITQCLAKTADERPANAAALLDALRIARRESTTRRVMAEDPPRELDAPPLRPARMKIALAVAVAVVVVLALYGWHLS